tara:strand:+ start:1363 stop:1797 length:435 start_codon:yes stop_codon:yes gene_type:complete
MIGNIGLHHACSQASAHGWKVSLLSRGWKPISRKINSVNFIIANESSRDEFTVQVLVDMDSRSIPFNQPIENSSIDFIIICTPQTAKIMQGSDPIPLPHQFVMTKQEIIDSVSKTEDGYSLDYSKYSLHKDKWEKFQSGFDLYT